MSQNIMDYEDVLKLALSIMNDTVHNSIDCAVGVIINKLGGAYTHHVVLIIDRPHLLQLPAGDCKLYEYKGRSEIYIDGGAKKIEVMSIEKYKKVVTAIRV